MNMLKIKNKKIISGAGFTIIELLVVIAIVGLLGSIVFVSTRGSTDKAKIAKVLQYSASLHHLLGADIVGEWNFEESPDNNVNIYDTSGNNNNGTWTGTPERVSNDASSQLGKAGKFDGTEYVRIEHSASLDMKEAITISVWVKPDTGPGYHVIACKGSFTYFFSTNSGRVALLIGKADRSSWNIVVFGNTALNNARWYHLVGTYKNGVGRVYVDGVEDRRLTGSNENIGSYTAWLSLGSASSYYSGYYFNGIIDELRIYNLSLTSAEIQKLYAEGAEKHGLTVK